MSDQPVIITDADTYDWDTVFALNFDHANAGITANWPNVDASAKTLAQANPRNTINVTATLGPWQLAEGGDGENVYMSVPVTGGTFNGLDATYTFTGTGDQTTKLIISVDMNWVPDPDQFSFSVVNTNQDNIVSELNNSTIGADLQADFTKNGKTLSSSATVTVRKASVEWIITDGADSYYVYSYNDKNSNTYVAVYQYNATLKQNLTALDAAASADDPAVVFVNIINSPVVNDGTDGSLLAGLVSEWFNTNIGKFNQVFAALDISLTLDQSDQLSWLKPTSTSYAVVDNGSTGSSIFGVLTMVENNPPPSSHQVSPNAIPAGAEAGFLISGPTFMRRMMLPGMQAVFNNAPASDFEIVNDGLTVQNLDRILFGKFHLSDDPQATVDNDNYGPSLDQKTCPTALSDVLVNAGIAGTDNATVEVTDAGSQWVLTDPDDSSNEWILTLSGSQIQVFPATELWIEAGDFQVTLNHTWLEISFNNVVYPENDDYDMYITYSEHVPLTLKDQGGKKIFWTGDASDRSFVANAKETKSAITREIVMGAVATGLSLICIAGPIAEGLYDAAQVTEDTSQLGEGVVSESSISNVESENPGAAKDDEEETGTKAVEQSKGRITSIKAAFKTPKWKIAGGITALVGVAAGANTTVDAVMKHVLDDEWEDVPGFDDFASSAITPYSFPNLSGFTLTSAGLAGSLQIGMTVNSTGGSTPTS